MNTLQFTILDNKNNNKQFYVNTPSKPMYINNTQTQTINAYQSPRIVPENTTKKMSWGEPIWFLFHTLAHKVKEEYFQLIRIDLLNNIYNICNNLPCPMCANHATDYMNKVNFKTIIRKKDLKDLLFVFHNNVNERKGLPIFQYADLDSKYNSANTKNIIYNFINTFQKKSNSINMIANDMYRVRLVALLKDWFNKNIQFFDP